LTNLRLPKFPLLLQKQPLNKLKKRMLLKLKKYRSNRKRNLKKIVIRLKQEKLRLRKKLNRLKLRLNLSRNLPKRRKRSHLLKRKKKLLNLNQ
jgi:hypothetical protein